MSFAPAQAQVCASSSWDSPGAVLFCKKIYCIRETRSVIFEAKWSGQSSGECEMYLTIPVIPVNYA